METKHIEYTPHGVCSKFMTVDVTDDGIIRQVGIVGGCNGNTQGICSLLKGMRASDAIDRLEGINCNGKDTSCPDQMSKALRKALQAIGQDSLADKSYRN